MKSQYNKTITACFVGYIVQAIVNNFTPLLFLFFQKCYHIPISKITLLVTFNFGIQLLVDFLSVRFVDKIGYRISMIIAHVLAAAGLLLLTVLPEILPVSFIGILIAVMIYAVGGGLLEVLVSPVVEACPSDNKEKAMSLLHSFYCWGHAGVVLISTVFFYVVGIDSDNWFKASIEYENEKIQRLGSVVTNHGYSDWATTDISSDIKSMWYRFSRRDSDYCIECSEDGINFRQMRIFHMWEGAEKITYGIYACSPTEGSYKATFSNMQITECKWESDADWRD